MKKRSDTYYLVVGMGRSGMSMARFLHSKGFCVKATDKDPERKDAAQELNDLGIETQIGFHDQETFDRANTLVVSPGIPLDIPYIRRAVDSGTALTGDLDIFARYNTTPIVAITGTNGKTTTTTLVRDMLEASGIPVFMGGNIGTPLVEFLMQDSTARVVVAEVSSFQLDLARNFRPHVAALLNLAPDHLDRYTDLKAYEDSKWSIFKNQTHQDHAVINSRIESFSSRTRSIASTLYEFCSGPQKKISRGAVVDGTSVDLILPDLLKKNSAKISCKDLKELPGGHNRENLAAAALASLCAGASLEGISSALARFKNLAHRISFVREISGIQFYNDSKATNTDAVVRALQTFDTPSPGKRIILILGGREKGTDFSALVPVIKERVRLILAIGEAAPHILETFGSVCPVQVKTSMAQAVNAAHETGRSGEIVLLSPACASFDMYDNYKDRGNDFIARVRDLETDHG
ncbi:UDP-N-acetylmuramoyl-L-alanine--D-glutamate ligase [Desulfospira joergensenii]|uniref:UDP-N-acetylmuramoyl-L-alanine--D-glutamate ligase n=1 Tax=Desulfospira joergensenii TaxID=53329 RepID=UPI0003B3CF07|nr:UDP-N-acetylmuramoyl-L-alanine--D-glutamate ligase [Desulfospira joergensenii]